MTENQNKEEDYTFERERLESEEKRADEEMKFKRDKLEFEKKQFALKNRFLNRNLGVLITAAVTLLVVLIQAGQIWKAEQNNRKDLEISREQRQQELTLNRLENERRWKLDLFQFVSDNMNMIFSDNSDERKRIRNVMVVTFPTEIINALFQNLELSVPEDEKQVWRDGIAKIDVVDRNMKQQTLTELLIPMVNQLDRTQQAFNRWTSKNLYLEAKIIKEGNQIIKDLLISKAHLIPPDLQEDASKLILHYDVWLEEFARVRGGKEPDTTQPFVFVGPKGYPFPRVSAQRFIDRMKLLQKELGTGSDSTASTGV